MVGSVNYQTGELHHGLIVSCWRHWQTSFRDANQCSARDDFIQFRDVEGAHADATVAGRPPDRFLLRGAVDVDAAGERVAVGRFLAIKPEDARHDGVAPSCVRREHFTGAPAGFEDSAEGGPVADLLADAENAKRCAVATWVVSGSKLRCRDGVDGKNPFLIQDQHPLLPDAHDDFDPRIGLRCQGSAPAQDNQPSHETMLLEWSTHGSFHSEVTLPDGILSFCPT